MTSNFPVANNLFLNVEVVAANIVIDGVYGKKTKSALVKAWQTEVGNLYVDGIFGPNCKNAAKLNLNQRVLLAQ